MFVHAQAPARIGIAGGGSDLPAWTQKRPGRCLTLAIAAYTHVVVIDRPDRRVVVAGRRLDEAEATTEIAHGLARESLLMHGFEDSVEMHIASQLTSRGSGLGVSSSIAVAMAAALSRARRLGFYSGDPAVAPTFSTTLANDDPATVAEEAWKVEIDRLRRPIGRQDHMAAAHGGLKLYGFKGDTARVERTFSDDDARWLAKHLLLVQLPDGHDSRAILSGVERAEQVEMSYDALELAVWAVENRDLYNLGKALTQCHEAKKSIPGAVPASVADVVERLDFVYGCKVAGAGGGGHVVVVCDPVQHEAVRRACGLPVTTVSPDLRGVRSEGWL